MQHFGKLTDQSFIFKYKLKKKLALFDTNPVKLLMAVFGKGNDVSYI